MVQGQHWNQNNVCSKLSIKTKNDIFIVDVVDAGWDPQKCYSNTGKKTV